MIPHPVTGRPLLDPDVLPIRVRAGDRWAGWVYGPPQPNGRRKKMPTDPATGRPIDATDPANLRPLAALLAAAGADQLDGVGYSLDPADQLLGVDLDDVVDPTTGELSPMAAGIVDDLPHTYAEVSPSLTGLRVLALGRLDPDGRCRAKVAGLGWGDVAANLEVYPRRKTQFVTLTGNVLHGRAGLLADYGDYLRGVQASLAPAPRLVAQQLTGVGFDGDADALLAVALRASNGDRIRRLWCGDWSGYGSPSDALMGLAGFLGFYTGPDPDRLFALMSISPLVADTERLRPKWWTPRSRGPWGLSCCARPAILSRTVFYSGSFLAGSEYSPPTRVTKSVRSDPRGRLIDYCRTLAGMKPDGVFHLGIRAAGKASGLRRSQAAVLLRQLVTDGVLVDVDKAKPTPRPGPASTFRFVSD